MSFFFWKTKCSSTTIAELHRDIFRSKFSDRSESGGGIKFMPPIKKDTCPEAVKRNACSSKHARKIQKSKKIHAHP